MRIEYTCKDGSRTLALWPSMALLHWLGRSHPTRPIENPEPFKFYVVGSPVPGDDQEMFLTLVYAEVERRWNKTPPFEVVPPVPPNPKMKHGGKKYQARCLEVQHFFKDKMLIVKAILESPHLTREQMVEQAKKDAGISRATFFRWQKKLNEANGNANYPALANLQAKGTKPTPVKIEELPCDAQDLTHEPEPRLASMKQKKTLQADNGCGDVSCLRLVPFPYEEAQDTNDAGHDPAK